VKAKNHSATILLPWT